MGEVRLRCARCAHAHCPPRSFPFVWERITKEVAGSPNSLPLSLSFSLALFISSEITFRCLVVSAELGNETKFKFPGRLQHLGFESKCQWIMLESIDLDGYELTDRFGL